VIIYIILLGWNYQSRIVIEVLIADDDIINLVIKSDKQNVVPGWRPVVFGGIQKCAHVSFTSPGNVDNQYTCNNNVLI
jgi:hypothetical protein